MVYTYSYHDHGKTQSIPQGSISAVVLRVGVDYAVKRIQ